MSKSLGQWSYCHSYTLSKNYIGSPWTGQDRAGQAREEKGEIPATSTFTASILHKQMVWSWKGIVQEFDWVTNTITYFEQFSPSNHEYLVLLTVLGGILLRNTLPKNSEHKRLLTVLLELHLWTSCAVGSGNPRPHTVPEPGSFMCSPSLL